MNNRIEAFGRDGGESDDAHSFPDRLRRAEVREAVVDGHLVSACGEALAEFFDHDFESGITGRHAARSEESDARQFAGHAPSARSAQQRIAHGVEKKQRVELRVAAPEAARFLPEPVGPCDSGALHPRGGECALSGQQHECIPDGEKHPARVAPEVVDDPPLLPLTAESDPNEVRLRFRDGAGEFCFVHFVPGTEWRRQCSGDFDIRLDSAQVRDQVPQGFLRAPEEKMSPWPRGGADHFFHEVGAVNAVGQLRPLRVEAPPQWHSVGQHEIEPAHHLPEIRPMPRQRNDMRIARRHGRRSGRAGQTTAFLDG